MIWFEEYADSALMGCAGKMFFNRVVAPRFLKRTGDLAMAETAERDELPTVRAYLESVMPGEGGFLVGDTVTLADLAIASSLANFAYMDVAVDGAIYSRTRAFAERMLARPSFAEWVSREEALLARTAA